MTSASGESVYLDRQVLRRWDVQLAMPWTKSSTPVYEGGRKAYRPNYLQFSYRSKRRVVVFLRPVTNLSTDTLRTAASLIDEALASSHVVRPASKGGSWMLEVPDTSSTPYLVVWMVAGVPPTNVRAPASRDSCELVGAAIVDPIHNRLLWATGGDHAK
jgi:hypothetical protein